MSNGTIGYLCVQGWGEGGISTEVGALVAGDGVSSITDPNAAANPILGDYSTLVLTSDATEANFETSLSMLPNDAELNGLVTVALLGIRMTPMDTDTVMRAELTVGSNTYQSAAAIYGQSMDRALPSGSSDAHTLFGSGVTNIVFHDLPVSVLSSSVQFTLALDAGDIASKSICIGSVFLGLQIPLQLNPRTFTWSVDVLNDRYRSRAGVDYSSNGVMIRNCTFEVQRASFELLSGIGADFYTDSVPIPNLFRAGIANIGQPMLLSAYPHPVVDAAWFSESVVGNVPQRLLSVRQNFFAIYGLLERAAEMTVDEYNEGIGTEYRTRYRFGEVR